MLSPISSSLDVPKNGNLQVEPELDEDEQFIDAFSQQSKTDIIALRCWNLLRSKKWTWVLVVTILLNSTLVIASIVFAFDHKYSVDTHEIPLWFLLIEFSVNFILTAELYVKYRVYSKPLFPDLPKFSSQWSTVFDLIVVSICWLVFFLSLGLYFAIQDNPSSSSKNKTQEAREEKNTDILSIIANIVRITRDIFSIIRLFSLVKNRATQNIQKIGISLEDEELETNITSLNERDSQIPFVSNNSEHDQPVDQVLEIDSTSIDLSRPIETIRDESSFEDDPDFV